MLIFGVLILVLAFVNLELTTTRYGGGVYTSSWCKFFLAILGVYEWEGINSVPPELWYLPFWLPFHPGRTWCHCRMVYLPMSFIYGKQWSYMGT